MSTARSPCRRRSHRRRSSVDALPAAAASAFIDPPALMRIKNLQLRARVVVEGFLRGMHRSPYHGFSVEFSEYRQYTPGDDLRYLDWRLFARTDRYYIKRFEDETNLRCYLLVDLSRSMGYGSGESRKSEYARTLAATLAYFLFTQRDAVGLVTFDEAISDYLPPRYRPGHLQRLMVVLEREPRRHGDRPGQPLEQIAEIGPQARPGRADLRPARAGRGLADEARLPAVARARVVVLRVLDPAEVDFTFADAGMFHDVESGRRFTSIRARRGPNTSGDSPNTRPNCERSAATWDRLRSADDRSAAGAGAVRLAARAAAARAAAAAAGGPATEGATMSFLTPLYMLGLLGRLAADPVSPDPPDAEGRVSVQLADVPVAVAAAAHAPQPARASVAPAVACGLALGLLAFAFARPFWRQTTPAAPGRRRRAAAGRPRRYQREHAPRRSVAAGQSRSR